MALQFNAKKGETIAREKLIAYINVGTSDISPTWAPIGKRVVESSMSFDWQKEDKKDVLGNTFSTMKRPIITQPFDAWDLEGGEAAQEKIYNLAFVEQNAQALCNMDMLIAHWGLSKDDEVVSSFAERYKECSIEVTELGGEGGGNLSMSIDVTYAGKRTVGSVSKSGDTVEFTENKGVD